MAVTTTVSVKYHPHDFKRFHPRMLFASWIYSHFYFIYCRISESYARNLSWEHLRSLKLLVNLLITKAWLFTCVAQCDEHSFKSGVKCAFNCCIVGRKSCAEWIAQSCVNTPDATKMAKWFVSNIHVIKTVSHLFKYSSDIIKIPKCINNH